MKAWTLPFVLLAPAAAAQERPIAFVNARVITSAGPELDSGTVVVQGGKFVAVGASGVTIPQGAEVQDVAGKVLMPGLVDTHSHVGGGWGADGSAPIQPDVRLLDAVNPRDPGFRKARAGGITTVNVMPGSGHLLSGQTLYLKLRNARTIDDLLIRDAAGRIAGGMKMANGTNSHGEAPFPGTRGKSASLVREQLLKAQGYREKLQRAGTDAEKTPDRDLNLEALVEVLEGKRVVHHHTHRHDDILTALRLRDEFGLKMVLHHASEAWKVAEEVAKAGAPCSVIVVDSPGGKLEARDMSLGTGAALEKAGARVAFHTDDYITDSRLFLRSGALGVRGGMTRKGAIEALTSAGARMLELDARVGTIEVGKDADLVVLSGDPFSVYTQVRETWVEGVKVFDWTRPDDRLYAEGGYGAGVPSAHAACCFGGGEAER